MKLENLGRKKSIRVVLMKKIILMASLFAALAVCIIIRNKTLEKPIQSDTNQIEIPISISSTYEEDSSAPADSVKSDESYRKYTEDELFCMAATIYNEAGGDACSDETRKLVGYVVLNRVNDPRFPDTIREVLEAKNQYGRFCQTGVKFADRHTLPQEQHAVERAYRIAQEVLECEEIPIPSTVVFQAEFEQGTSIYTYQDGLYFCHAKEVI